MIICKCCIRRVSNLLVLGGGRFWCGVLPVISNKICFGGLSLVSYYGGGGGGGFFFSVGCRCPWTGTGIGRKNMLAFKVFVVGVNVLCYFSVILVIVALLYGLRKGK